MKYDLSKIVASLPQKARHGLVHASKTGDRWGCRYGNAYHDFGVYSDHDPIFPGAKIRMSQIVAGGFLSPLGYALAQTIQANRKAEL